MHVYQTARKILALVASVSVAAILSGCASTAEGITRALVDTGKGPAERQCTISGPAFGGLEARFDDESGELTDKTVRVVFVHGIGTHEPGWSTPIALRLASKLQLKSLDKDVKQIKVVSPDFPDEPLGFVTIGRMFDKDSGAELITYELSWSEITEGAKKTLSYDTSAYYSDQRAEFNQDLKVFLNDRLLDPVAYLGPANGRIRAAAAETLCFASQDDWKALPASGPAKCTPSYEAEGQNLSGDQLVFITHSLGSRIVTDVLQEETAELRTRLDNESVSLAQRKAFEGLLDVIQEKSIRLYMMANQLPLFDAALPAPRVVNQIQAYCEPDGKHYDERILKNLSVVAFSDPNDPLSYGLPLGYANNFMDSRLCPTVVNVSINVTDVVSPLGLTEIASPLKAHAGYQQDDIVLSIIAGGVGTDVMAKKVAERCTWIDIE
jgi:hypothetical protein